MYAHDNSEKQITELRKSMDCVDGVFIELVGEHKELEKHYSDYKTLTQETNSRLSGCEKVENPDMKKEYVPAI